MIGPTSSRALRMRGVVGRHPIAQMALDIFHHHDGVIDHQTDREHDREEGEEIEREPEDLHEKDPADERDRDRDYRHERGTQRAEKEKDHDHDDEEGFGQGLDDFVDCVVDVLGRVVGDLACHAGGQFVLDVLHLGPDPLHDVDRVRVRQHPDAHEDRLLLRETHFRVVIFRAQDDIRDVPQANELPVCLAHDELAKLIRAVQVGVDRSAWSK